MRTSKYLIFSLWIFSLTMFSQTDKITGNEFQDLSRIFSPSTVQVDIMDDWTYNPRYSELFEKIDSVIIESPKWLDKYFNKIKGYEPMYYDKRFGLSKREFNEYLELEKEQGLISSGKSKLEIIKNEETQVITFKGNNDLSYMTDIKIDLKNSRVFYKDLELKNIEEYSMLEIESTLNSDSKGYIWSLMDNETLEDTFEQSEYDFTQIKFTLLQLEKNGRFFISITERSFQNELICSIDGLKEFAIML